MRWVWTCTINRVGCFEKDHCNGQQSRVEWNAADNSYSRMVRTRSSRSPLSALQGGVFEKDGQCGAQPDGENKIIAHWRMDCLSCSRSTALGVSFFIIIFQPLTPFSWILSFVWYDFGSCEILYSFWKDKKQHGPWWGLSLHLNCSFRNFKHSQHRHSVKNSDLSHFKDSAIPHQWISIHLPLRSNLESWN